MNPGFEEGQGPQQWFQSLPIVTRCWLGASVLVTVAGNFGFVHLSQLLFDATAIYQKWELWRLITCFCYVGPFEFSTAWLLYVLVSTSLNYERMGAFNTGAQGGTADYITALMFGMTCILILQIWVYPLAPIFTVNMVDFVLYIWSRRHPMMNVDMWGIPMKSVYLPFGYLALNSMMGNDVKPIVEGMAVGHVYYYLVDVVPRLYGTHIIRTPQILIDLLGVGEYRG